MLQLEKHAAIKRSHHQFFHECIQVCRELARAFGHF
jgi:hypothetical protein